MDIFPTEIEGHIFSCLSIAMLILGLLAPRVEKLFWPFMIYMVFMFFYMICFLACWSLGLWAYFSALRVLGLFIAVVALKALNILVDFMIGKY